MNTVIAHIARDANGVCRVFAKRAKYKHWFELGRHAATDAAFEQALAAGTVRWETKIVDPTFLKKPLDIKKISIHLYPER